MQPECGWLSESGLPEKLGGLFRRSRVDVKAGGPFEAGDIGQSWNDLDVPVVVSQRTFLDGRAVHDEIVCRPFQHLFELSNSGAEDPGEVGHGGPVGILEMGFVALGQNPGFKGETRRIGREHGEAVGFADQSHAGGGLVADDVAVDAALLEIVKDLGGVHLFLDALGDDGERDQLGVRMLQRGARGVAMVLEEEDVTEAAVFLEIVDALLEGPEGLFDELLGHVAEGLVVVGPFDDDLMGADAVHLVVHALALAVQLAFDAEDGEFIGHDAHAPPGLVAVPGGAVGQHLGRCLVLIPVAERADGGCGRRHRLPDEIAGAFGAIRGYNDPSPCDGVLTQFRQVRGFLRFDGQRSTRLDYIVAETTVVALRGSSGEGNGRFDAETRRRHPPGYVLKGWSISTWYPLARRLVSFAMPATAMSSANMASVMPALRAAAVCEAMQ